jgi:hypothetical protein
VTNVLIYVSLIHSEGVCITDAQSNTVHFSVTVHKAVLESMHCIDTLLLLLTLYNFAQLHRCTSVTTAAAAIAVDTLHQLDEYALTARK